MTSVADVSLPEMRALATSTLHIGKESFAEGNFTDAAAELGVACENFAKVFGELGEECGEAYLSYGKALFHVAVMENEVLGNALEGMAVEEAASSSDSQVESPSKLKEEEKVEVQGSVGKALTENFTKHNLIAKHHNVVESEEDLEDEDVEMTDSSSKPEDSVEAEDLSNLQLAWEMFELAKVIFGKKVKDTMAEKRMEAQASLWEAITGLGEVAFETGNYELALEDFTSCLQARQAELPKDSRSIAESHFQIARTSAAMGKSTETEANMKAAILVLEERATNLSKMEFSPHLIDEVTDLEELGISLEETLVEFKEESLSPSDQVKRKLSAGSPSAKLAGVDKAPKIDDAKPIGATTVGNA